MTKEQLDAFIEREAETKFYPHVDKKAVKLGAQLLAPLLLQAVEALQQIHKHDKMLCPKKGCETLNIFCSVCAADEALAKIETALKEKQ